MAEKYYAHSIEGKLHSDWQPLDEHLKNVAEMARSFADAFGAGDWGYLAGLWHDLGKYSEAFQQYLNTVNNPDSHVSEIQARIDHSSAGAQHAAKSIDILGHLLTYVIAGHHSGLLNGRDTGACIDARLKKKVEPWQHGLKELPPFIEPALPVFLQQALGARNAFSVAFFTRMIFSCLVDADFLDTEEAIDPERGAFRPDWPSDILAQMEGALNQHVKEMPHEETTVNRQRTVVRNACIEAAEEKPRLFSLTVPTGGGKTLASLAFALRHARLHGLERLIYVIPFTSIIEQNANVFRDVMTRLEGYFAEEVVVEHHSNFDPDKETTPLRLVTENWDAPLVVTTAVQFYESLFACKTSRCRKLHRMTKSVIILDEAQTLPVDFLEPCLRVLNELTCNYGSSVVLCTATQPAIQWRNDFSIGLKNVWEIIRKPESLYRTLRRVNVMDIGKQADTEIAERMIAEKQALCIVNTRGHAGALFKAIGEDDAHFHLSALMCPAHRTSVLDEIRRRLKEKLPCRVISTQLIEAGVDVDFPVVFRSVAGIDSIAQAAGRCNRNGTFPDKGHTYVFRSEHHSSERFFAETTNNAEQVLELYDDALSLDAVEHYFRLYYWDQKTRWDDKKIMHDYNLLNDRAFPFSFAYARTAREFRLIEQLYRPVIIPWGDGFKLCEQLRSIPVPSRKILRKLQRYTIQIPERTWRECMDKSIIECRLRDGKDNGFAILVSPELHYSEKIGFCLDNDAILMA